jgi:hypothetical protein
MQRGGEQGLVHHPFLDSKQILDFWDSRDLDFRFSDQTSMFAAAPLLAPRLLCAAIKSASIPTGCSGTSRWHKSSDARSSRFF